MSTLDLLRRPLRNLRVSVTDRCNLRCKYCMPEENYRWLPRHDLLHFGEIRDLVRVFLDAGVDKVRLTGGEPLLRRELRILVEMLAAEERIKDLALTTNGVLLAPLAAELKRAGLKRLTVSLDTLDRDRYRRLARLDGLARTLEGLAAARRAGFTGTKIDCVVIRGENDGELEALLDFGREIGAEVRFIEYMDVGGATGWSMAQVVPRSEILERLAAARGKVTPLPPASPEEAAAPAERFALADGTTFGVIASTTRPFCAGCDRSRLTADGTWYLCLYAQGGVDLKSPFRAGAARAELLDLVLGAWRGRSDRGAEQRLALAERAPAHDASALRSDPRLEMHTRGG